jgi:hypothetical protein
MTPDITLSQALSNPSLFGGTFGTPSFWTWKVVAKLIDGLPLTEAREIDLFEQCTGRKYNRFSRRAVRRLIILAGRRAGKDRFESAVAVWRSALSVDWRQYISAGEQAVVLLIGADKKQASILRRYCYGLLQVPLLKAEVTRYTGDVVEFKNGSTLEIVTNDPRLIRGRSAIAVLGSECCYWRTDEFNAASDEEVVHAALPSMALCPDTGLLILASSVHRKVGYMYKQYRRLYENDDAEDLCWFAPSATMNPKLPSGVVANALAENKSKASAEFLNIWREDIADFMPLDVIEATTDWGVTEREPVPGVFYFAYADPAGGTGRDSFTLAIAHLDPVKTGVIVIDAMRERRPRFVTADVIRDYITLLRSYRIDTIMSDDYGGGHYADEWRRGGMKFRDCPLKKSDIYVAALALLEAKRGLVLDYSKYRTQAAALERRIVGGNEVIDHPASSHDDIVNAIAGVLVYATRALRVAKIPMVGATWWSKQTGFVEPGRSATNVPGGPTYRAEVPSHYLKNGQSGEPWRRYTTDAGVSTRGGRWWGPV